MDSRKQRKSEDATSDQKTAAPHDPPASHRTQRSRGGGGSQPRAEKSKKPRSTDDCGQIDSIIGDFGKYQLMIFVFKILIGATSAFNNLGVTFYAPSDFISYWCADSGSQTPQQFTQLQNSTAGYGGLLASAHPLSVASAVQPLASAAEQQTIGQLMGEFFTSNGERARRRNALEFSSDTPRRASLRRECDYLSPLDNKRHKCTAFQYDTGIWQSTIIDEWDLVCDRSLFISITQSLYMAGFIVSFLMFGYLSDRFGRWNSLLLGALIEIASGFGCAFAGSARQFMLFRFLLGLGTAGRSSSSYLIMIEWTGQSWRMHISTLGSLGWVAGYCSMPWIVMHFLHFRHMQLFVCFYESIFLLWLLFLPESPRWLLTHKRFQEAHQVLLRAARFNGLLLDLNDHDDGNSTPKPKASPNGSTTGGGGDLSGSSDGSMIMSEIDGSNPFARRRLSSLGSAHEASRRLAKERAAQAAATHLVTIPTTGCESRKPEVVGNSCERDDRAPPSGASGSLQPYTMEEFEAKFAKLAETIALKEFTKNEDRLSILDLFKWHNLRGYFFILAFAWAVNSFIYYGIALNVGNFGAKNLFVSFTWAGATELPSILFTMICMKMLPRKTTNVFMFSLIFLLCALQMPLKYYSDGELGWLQQSTMILAKLFNSCSFTVILYQTMELFPTSIRQTAYSSAALAGRVGSILAPFIKELSQMTNNLVPPLIYAVLSLAEIVLIRHLPETQGSDLPDTLLEAEKFKGTAAAARRGRSRSGGGRGNSKMPA